MPTPQVIRTTTVGPQDIGKGTSPQSAGRVTLRAYVPLIANIVAIRAYIRNKPWGEGQCSLGPSNWVLAPLDGREPMGWCRAEGRGQGSTEQAQWAAVEFISWSHCNSRDAKLEVDYEIFQNFVDSSAPEKEIDESLWKCPSML
jgi:hypothetical protein